jgi:hypothetical protein
MRPWRGVIVLLSAMAIVLIYFYFTKQSRPEVSEQTQAGNSVIPVVNRTLAPRSNSLPLEAAGRTSPVRNAPVDALAAPPAHLLPAPDVMASPLYAAPGSPAPNIAPETLLENVRTSVRQYGSMFDGNPVGDNREITAALNGENPKGTKFLDPDNGMRINAKGELVDGWGTPFFFHQLSGTETEIRSAGPDKRLWTSDDLVTR